MIQRYLALVCCVIALVVTGCTKNGDTPPADRGNAGKAAEQKPAPDISVQSLDGKNLALSTLKGKVVVLNFWATWCPPCREEIPSMMKLNSLMSGKQFQMVCVSVDEGGKPAVEEYFRKSGNMLPAYIEPTGQAAKQYGITGVPETFVIDKQGIVVKKVIGGLDWSSPEVVAFLEGLMK